MFQLPDDWNDDERMAFLFRDFKAREFNPLGYDEKMDFWRTLIKNFTKQRSKATFSIKSLMESFVRKNSQPVCLRKVIEVLRQDKELIPIQSESWTGWMASWFVSSEPDDSEILVNAKVFDDCREDIENSIKSAGFRDQKVPYREIWAICKGVCDGNETLFKCLISRMADVQGGFVIFPKNSDLIKPLSEHDRALLAISDASRKIEMKISQSLQALDTLKAEALRNKAQGNTAAAIRNLRKKKRIEKIVDRQYLTLDKLHDMEADLDNQKDMPKILDGFKLATSALKSVNGDVDNIHGIVDELQEAAAEHREIEESISTPVGFSEETDLSVLEDELQNLLEENEQIPFMPSVPTEEPRGVANHGKEKVKRVALGYFE